MADIDSWVEAQEFQITLDANGRIIDYLDNNIKRPNTPEERIRQKMVQILHCEFAYPMSHIGIEKQINIGREIKRADIGFITVQQLVPAMTKVTFILLPSARLLTS